MVQNAYHVLQHRLHKFVVRFYWIFERFLFWYFRMVDIRWHFHVFACDNI